jgi:Flp pilus assembly secretin CpaC
VVGAALRNVGYNDMETELIILVTAKLVEPLNSGAKGPVPGDLHVAPSDWELFIWARFRAPAAASRLHKTNHRRMPRG